MTDSYPAVILGSVALAVLAYWLNGMSERSLERRKVNYSSKLESFETVNSCIAIVEIAYSVTKELAAKILASDKPSIEQGSLHRLVVLSLTFPFPDELKHEKLKLEKAMDDLEKLNDLNPSKVRNIAIEVSRGFLSILNYHIKNLESTHFGLVLVVDSDKVISAFLEYVSALTTGIDTMAHSDDLKEKEKILNEHGENVRNRRVALLLAMRHELDITMASWMGRKLANWRFRKFKKRNMERMIGSIGV